MLYKSLGMYWKNIVQRFEFYWSNSVTIDFLCTFNFYHSKGKFIRRQLDIMFFLLFKKKGGGGGRGRGRIWYFMQIVSSEGNLHEMSNSVSREK